MAIFLHAAYVVGIGAVSAMGRLFGARFLDETATLIGTLGVVVFDEARYYRPLLPFVSLLAGGSTMVLYGKK